MIKMIASLILIGVLASCTSKTTNQTQFYLLNTTQLLSDEKSGLINEPDYVLEKIRVPDYLMQPNLAMQVADNRLHQSNFHLWAEPISDGAAKVILRSLQSKGIKIHNHSESDLDVDRLFIQISHFFPTDQGDVVLNGKFWVENPQSKKIISGSRFSFRTALNDDGYSHSVSQMASLLEKLSVLLIDSLDNKKGAD